MTNEFETFDDLFDRSINCIRGKKGFFVVHDNCECVDVFDNNVIGWGLDTVEHWVCVLADLADDDKTINDPIFEKADKHNYDLIKNRKINLGTPINSDWDDEKYLSNIASNDCIVVMMAELNFINQLPDQLVELLNKIKSYDMITGLLIDRTYDDCKKGCFEFVIDHPGIVSE